MLVYTQRLKADHEERELLYGLANNIKHGAVCNICDFFGKFLSTYAHIYSYVEILPLALIILIFGEIVLYNMSYY